MDIDKQTNINDNAPWTYDRRSQTISDKDGYYIAMVRGWGHLTGGGHTALGLTDKEAAEIQDERGRRIAKVPEYEAQLKAQQARIVELEKSKLSDLFLANFPYEDWQHGDDDKARIGDWVHLGWQDHNGSDHSDGIGRICLHHDTEIPVILMVEGFEDDGEPHGTYTSMSFHPWNTISRVSEKEARQALKETDSKHG